MLLIIEDNLDLVNLYRIAMGMIHITPEVEMTGPSALRRIESGSAPEVVILDLHLKKEGGIEIAGEELFVKMRSVWEGTKIIVVSADIVSCAKLRGAADAVVEKPIADMSQFLEMVRGFMGGAA
jgi:DNA-binding response OmpR family regulator